jgi:hypothetical protein
MSRLRSEFARLYLPEAQAPTGRAPTAADLQDGQGRVRAMVLELRAPAEWDLLRAVWRGVQSDLGLPPPAIAVSGVDGLQLWFSAPQVLPAAEALGFLEALRRHYLAGVPRHRLRLMPGPAAEAPVFAPESACVPALQADGSNWSAFVAPDLAPLFVDTPWLEMAPSDEGQASLLAHLQCMPVGWLATSLDTLVPPAPPSAPDPAGGGAPGVRPVDPRAFLQQVLNDEGAPLALRVEAAKALLAAGGGPG